MNEKELHDQVAKGNEMSYQCPKCGFITRIPNAIAKMFAADPNALKSIKCVKCAHPYNARALLKES